jgi:hypothetical protein
MRLLLLTFRFFNFARDGKAAATTTDEWDAKKPSQRGWDGFSRFFWQHFLIV